MAETEHGSWEEAPRENERVYSGFLGLAKWATILISIVLILMAIFLV
ncbi:aa3-type cytochrome c oxidase subunit IV [Sandaracinobacter sp. RS1-74]|nr:aa3-type cytochrome c oxidase subunit IV [Sandaracinobacteroides sayramensis]MCG2840299.1 aa3-type cytochrome c oxidase subunit IV [Sandaracinobacteroides sayramensis]